MRPLTRLLTILDKLQFAARNLQNHYTMVGFLQLVARGGMFSVIKKWQLLPIACC